MAQQFCESNEQDPPYSPSVAVVTRHCGGYKLQNVSLSFTRTFVASNYVQKGKRFHSSAEEFRGDGRKFAGNDRPKLMDSRKPTFSRTVVNESIDIL
ncbi:hypothetical protein KM043_014753 [Ampulex compressa]|nr:hypothetical protein KM043_014753 [Ampulex compressa]